MYINFFIFLALLVSSAYSRTGTFRLISFGKKAELKIFNGKKYILNPVEGDDLLYGITINELPEKNVKYRYIIDGKAESFYRIFNTKTNITHNEFYGRKQTIVQLKSFSHPAGLTNWNRSIGRTNVFDNSYIPTVHLTGNNTEKLFQDPNSFENITVENAKIYLKDTVESFDDVYASAKNTGFEKFQIKLKFGKNKNMDTIGTKSAGKGIHGRYVFKLRNGGEDPLNLRQLIYGNIIQALGMPSLHSVMVRLYYNKKPMGFYTLQEDVTTNSFIKSEFYGNPKNQTINAPDELGYVLDGTTGSDFEYKPDDHDYYGTFDSDDDKKRLIALCAAIDKLDTSDEKALKEFESKWFDIDTFHKAMAMEYLTGDWDGYWYTTSNFAVYDDPLQSTAQTYKFYFITQDHDETFGVGLTSTINKVGKKFPELSYTTMLNRTWHIAEDDTEHRVLVDKFIGSTPKLQKRFQNTLVAIVRDIFNPVVFRSVVSTYYNRYTPEVQWDYSITRVFHPDKHEDESPGYTYKDFQNNLEKGVGGLEWGLYEWVTLRAEAIKHELCITWKGDQTPPPKTCVPKVNIFNFQIVKQ